MSKIFSAIIGIALMLGSLGCVRQLSFDEGNGVNATPTYSAVTITEQEARAVLDQTIELVAKEKNGDVLCATTASPIMCKKQFDSSGGAAGIPTDPPTIVELYSTQNVMKGNTGTPGGYTFVLKGIDGLGKEYQTDFFVFGTDTSDRLKPFSAVYWSGAGFGDETSEDAITTK